MRIGVDIGGTNLVAGLVDDNYKLIEKAECPANATRNDEEIVADIIMLCKHNVSEAYFILRHMSYK